jgi:uncharacterized protein
MGLDGSLLVGVREPAIDGKANKAVVGVLANHFEVSKSCVVLKSGATSRYKVFVIDSDVNRKNH